MPRHIGLLQSSKVWSKLSNISTNVTPNRRSDGWCR